jgi:hypothetical protein
MMRRMYRVVFSDNSTLRVYAYEEHIKAEAEVMRQCRSSYYKKQVAILDIVEEENGAKDGLHRRT